MEIKVVCVCGQKYKFDVEPANGQMPWPVRCLVCNADGTPAANVLIAQRLAAAPVAAAAPAARPAVIHPLSMPVASQATTVPTPPIPAVPAPVAIAAPPPAPVPSPAQAAAQASAALRPMAGAAAEADHDTWKWWYYVVAGVCFAGYDIWMAYDKQSIKPLGGALPGSDSHLHRVLAARSEEGASVATMGDCARRACLGEPGTTTEVTPREGTRPTGTCGCTDS